MFYYRAIADRSRAAAQTPAFRAGLEMQVVSLPKAGALHDTTVTPVGKAPNCTRQ